LIDNYSFEYGYFDSNDPNPFPNYGIRDQIEKRLYLKKIQEIKTGTTNKEYLFDYYTDHALPNRFSFSQDLWGYYNGRSNNKLFPTTEINTGSRYVTINGGDRKVYPNYVNAGTLKQVTYPTGGKTEFLYESNTITGEQGFYIGTQYQTKVITGGELSNSNSTTPRMETTSNFTITSSFPFDNIIDYTITVDENCNFSNHTCPSIKITQLDGTPVYQFPTENNSGTINLPIGNYKLKIENGFDINNVNIVLRGRELLAQEENAFTGGLRIKEIRFKDSNNSILKKQAYEYHLFSDNQKSSGLSLSPPTFLFKNIPSRDNQIPCEKNTISSNAIFPLNGQSASHVTYTNVTQLNHDGDNGKIEHEFTYTSDSQLNSDNIFSIAPGNYPLVPSQDYSHRRGLPKSQKIYKKNGSNYQLVKESITNYSSFINSDDRNISSTNIAMSSLGIYDGAVRYENFSERYYQTQYITKDYYNNSQNFSTTTTDYFYDTGYTGRLLPIKTQVTSSKGQLIEAKTYYPDDVNALTGFTPTEKIAIERLQKEDLHQIGVPIQTETTVTNDLAVQLSKTTQRTVFNDLGSNDIVLPKLIQTAKGNDPLEDRLEYTRYDSKGNILEAKKSNGAHMVYLWGYNKQYPIAKIDNATFAEVASALNISETALLNYNETDLLVINGLRASLPKAMVSTYIYKPLVGVTSMTDPRGYTMTYEYDAFNRLEYVRDQNGKIYSKNEYNYKNQ